MKTIIGTKLRKVSDDSIWTITGINDTKIEVQRDKPGKKGKVIRQAIDYGPLDLSGFSSKLTKYTVKCFTECEVYANSKEDAIDDASMQMAEKQDWNDTQFDFDYEV